MTILLVLLFPAIGFALVGFGIHAWNKGVKNGTFQKSIFRKKK